MHFNFSRPPPLTGKVHRGPPREARGGQQGYPEGRRGSWLVDGNRFGINFPFILALLLLAPILNPFTPRFIQPSRSHTEQYLI